MARYTNLPDNKNKPFGGAYSVYDSDTLYMRDYLVQKYAVNSSYHDFESIKQDYFSQFKYFLSDPHKLNGYLCINMPVLPKAQQSHLLIFIPDIEIKIDLD